MRGAKQLFLPAACFTAAHSNSDSDTTHQPLSIPLFIPSSNPSSLSASLLHLTVTSHLNPR